jgi:hypothetical protein
MMQILDNIITEVSRAVINVEDLTDKDNKNHSIVILVATKSNNPNNISALKVAQ